MQSFLQKVVTHLHNRYGDKLSELCIVLPNRRASLFLKTHLSDILKKTFWAPETYATEDFIALLSELETTDNLTLLFELYETVKRVNRDSVDSFDDFCKWGQTAISDFNDIDRYLIDAKQLFGNLKDIKELESWSLNAEELTEFQKQYLLFWQSLGTYYFDFKNKLLAQKKSYQGLAYRVVADNLSDKINKHQWEKIIFVGFNALNRAEEKIISELIDSDKAEIIWDVDKYYTENSKQEAGVFFRKYRDKNLFAKSSEDEQKKNIVVDEDLLLTEKKTIHIIGASKNVAQAKYAGNLIHHLQKQQTDLKNTALVLADENLLFPVLHSLPPDLKDVNVTMGFPLNNTPFAGYVELLFMLHINAQKLAQGKTKYSFYYRDVLNLLNHPYTSLLTNNNSAVKVIKKFVRTVHEKNILFLTSSSIEKQLQEYPEVISKLGPLFNLWELPIEPLVAVRHLINVLKEVIIEQQAEFTKNEKSSNTSLDLEYLFAFTKITKRLEVLIKDYPESVVDIKSLHNLLKQIVHSTTLPFYGEPLMGLQVMGMLETRTLDFENVILLSCNENILPAGKMGNTFIPYELKKHFGLPVYSDKDAIFAYHFYRLLQRAKNIYLLYNTENDGFGMAEKSRFITQLEYELPKVNKNITIHEELFSIPVDVKKPGNVIVIKKTTDIIEKLNERAIHGFSPSALNKYINCPLQFYFQVIAGLKEAEEVEETIGADILGTVIHEVLETLYRPFIKKILATIDVVEMKKKVENLVIKGFEMHYGNKDTLFGKNLLVIKVAVKFINNFLDTEIELLSTILKTKQLLTIDMLEASLEAYIDLEGKTIKLHGNADRIDSMGSTTRIIDYKTGKAEDRELKIEHVEQLKTTSSFAKSFQLLMYAWMYRKMAPQEKPNLISGIITFRELSKGLKTVNIGGKNLLTKEVLDAFEEQLKFIIADLYNPHQDFRQTEDHDNCKYCSYKMICGR